MADLLRHQSVGDLEAELPRTDLRFRGSGLLTPIASKVGP
jgi:hypothetical protein